jgi:hypothetical protein
MILDRLGHLLSRFGTTPPAQHAAGVHASVWTRAAADHPDLLPDLIRQGGLLAGQPVMMQAGEPAPAPLDPYRLAYEAGRRDLALQLLSAAGLTTDDLNSLFKEQDYG